MAKNAPVLATRMKTFQEILEEKMGNAVEAGRHTRKLQDELNVVSKIQFEEDIKVTRMNRIAWMSQWSHNPMEWTREDSEAPIPGQDYAWRYVLTLETSTLYFTITVTERTDRNRDKFTVKVRGHQRELSNRHEDVQGGYTYNVEKYGSKDVIDELAFRSELDAHDAATEWTKRIYEDFKERIDWDREMRELAIKSGARFDK